jgi:hypothetical protein
VAQNYSNLVATNPDGTTKWKVAGKGFLGGPVVSPGNKQVVVGGYEINKPGYVAGVSTNGKPKWQVSLPKENGSYVRPQSRPKFSADGSVVYVGMVVNNEYTYLYAFNTGSASPNSNEAITDAANINSTETIKNITFTVFPNPAKDIINVKFSSLEESHYSISVTNVQGKVVLSKDGNAAPGINTLALNLNNLLKGIYVIQVQVGEQKSITQKIIKQ